MRGLLIGSLALSPLRHVRMFDPRRWNTRGVNSGRTEYLLRLEGLDDPALGAASRTALTLVASEMGSAETDIPWATRDRWPAEVLEAASRLCDRFVQEGDRDDLYMQTGVRSVADRQVREDFITFAPHAHDASFRRDNCAEIASLSDEGTSFVIWLTDQQRAALAEVVGADRVISLSDWRRAHPSMWRRWLNRLASRDR